MNLINNSALYTRRLPKIKNSRQLLPEIVPVFFKERLELLIGLWSARVIQKRKIWNLLVILYSLPVNGWVCLEILECVFQVDV